MPRLTPTIEIQPGIGKLNVGSLPECVEVELRRLLGGILNRYPKTQAVRSKIIAELVYEVNQAALLREAKIPAPGRGRARSVGKDFLSARVYDILNKYGIRGNTLSLAGNGHHRVSGAPGLVSELESAAMTAFERADNLNAPPVNARPARISSARKTLGEIIVLP